MKTEIVTDKKNELKMDVTGESHTIFNMLKSELLKSKDVDSCGYRQDHPLIDKVTFMLFTKSKSAKTMLDQSIAKLQKDLARIGRSFK
jgi:DNA-directed RNA polymerase subunit L